MKRILAICLLIFTASGCLSYNDAARRIVEDANAAIASDGRAAEAAAQEAVEK